MKLTFLGGTGTVTGSKYLIEDDQHKILIDCGIFRGNENLRAKNWQTFPVDPASIDAVILTNSHPDQSGFLPCLVKQGFKGPIFSTGGTRDLCHILLKDAAQSMIEYATHCNRHKLSKHHPAFPLFDLEDVDKCLPRFISKHFNTPFRFAGWQFEFTRSGHILGSAQLRIISRNETRITFSGVIGRKAFTIMRPPQPLLPTDYLVVDSTFGDRTFSKTDPKTELRHAIIECLAKGGSLLIPSFPAGRTEEILYLLYLLKKNREIPRLPIFLDSPMASNIAFLFSAYHSDHRLSEQVCAALFDDVYFAVTPAESKRIAEHSEPKIVFAADEMATGGRVLHHIKKMAPHERNTILFAGYQGEGTRGATMMNQAPFIKIHREYIKLAAKIINIESLSAQADSAELCDWLQQSAIQPKHVFVTRGEAAPSEFLRKKLTTEFGWQCSVPKLNQSVFLEEHSAKEERHEHFS